MKKLTKAEEEIMQIIWDIAPCTVADIRNYMEQELGMKKPPHSTVSTMVRILDDKKNFLKHTAYGRTFVYEPAVSKAEYSHQSVQKLVRDYFGGSMNRLVSFLVKEEDLSLNELNELVDHLEEE
ncbi:MAG TPA: BlaI/MecI/CopY family transcriptional regulator [Phaeodactylibacter sp.]|nr:BlaI/MecI/CopY family transcriptional regulator [Phaeodactylibacter sp.]